MIVWSAELKEIEKLYESFKGNLPDLEKELYQLIKTQDANVVMLYSRRSLEVIIADLCENELKRPRKTEPLKGIIDKLDSEEKVSSHIITSMHGVNSLSTYGTHPKEFEPEQVKPVLNNLATIIRWYQKYKDGRTIGKINTKEEQPQNRKPLKEVRNEERTKAQKEHAKLPKKKLLSGALIISVLLVVCAILAYPKIFKRNTLEKLRSSGERISIAVMPFQNMTNDTTLNVWGNGIQEILITSLSNSEELRVRQIESTNSLIKSKSLTNYSSITPSLAITISKKLDVNTFIYGSIKQVGTTIRLNTQLIDTKTNEVYKSFQIDGTAEKILFIVDSLSVMVKNFLIISLLEMKSPLYLHGSPTTSSPEAYKYYLFGENARNKGDFSTARNMFSNALAIDSNFALATLMLSVACTNDGDYEEARKWSIKAYEKREKMPLKQKILTNKNYAFFFETPYEELKYLRQYLEIDDQDPDTYYSIGFKYFSLFQYYKAIPEFEKSLEIYDKLDMKPRWIYNYNLLGEAYHKTFQYSKEKKLYKKADRDFPNHPAIIFEKAILSLTEGDTVTANKYIEQYKSGRREYSWSEATIAYNVGEIYNNAGYIKKAEEYHRLALSLEPDDVYRMYNLGRFLIYSDRNINEGLELIDKALKLRPDLQWYLLEGKGWGLYKQGKYKEAFGLLEKCRNLSLYYRHSLHLEIEEVKNAIADQQKNN